MVQYGQPTDTDAFDQHYRDVHSPLTRKVPGLVRFTIARPAALGGGEAPYLVAELDWESAESFGAAMRSPENQASGADLANFATGGVTITHFDVEDVTS